MSKSKRISVVLEQETYDKLCSLAKEDYRPVSNLIRHIVKLYIEKVESGKIKLSKYF